MSARGAGPSTPAQRALALACGIVCHVAFAPMPWTARVWTVDHPAIAIAWTASCVVGPPWKERRSLAIHGEAFARYRRRMPYGLPAARPLDPAALDRDGGPA